MNKNPEVGIKVGAEVDRSVGRAFDRAGREIKGVAREEKKLDRAVGATSGELKKQRRVLSSTGSEADDYSRSVGKASESNSVLSRSMSKVGEGLDGALNKWTALAGGVAGVGSAAMTLGFDERVTRLGIQANKSQEEMDALKETIFETSQLPDIKADPDQVLAAVEKIVEKTGDLELAKRNIRNIAMTLQATGAAGMDTGAMVADMADKFNIEGDAGLLQALDTLVIQGKQGAFTLQALASEGAAASAGYAAMGRSGKQAVTEMGALLQIGMMGSGSAAEAAGAFDSVLSDITANRDKFEKLGIELFDPEQLAKGKKVFRSIPDVLRETMAATGGDITQYSELFGDEAIRLVKVLGNEYQQTGMLKTMDDLLKVQANGTTIMNDSGRAAASAAATYRNLMFVWRDIADDAFSGPLQSIADATNSFDKDTLKLLLQVGAAGALGLGALAVGRKAWNIGAGAVDFVRGGRGGKAGGGGARGGKTGLTSGVTPVFVTNMGAGMGGAGIGGANSKTKGAGGGWWNKLKGGAKAVGSKATPIALGLGALSIGSTLLDDDMGSDEKIQSVSTTAGGMGGAVAGAAAGALVGSVVPVIGTAIGGLVGGVLGSMGGGWLGSVAGDWFTSDSETESVASEDDFISQQNEKELQAVRNKSNAYQAALKGQGKGNVTQVSGDTIIHAQIAVSNPDPVAAGQEAAQALAQLESQTSRRGALAFGDS